jgi:periplasmic copper chaperone A
MTLLRPSRAPRRRNVAMALASMALLVAACGSDDGSTADATTTTAPPAPEIVVTDAWARTSPAVASAGAVYLNIANEGDVDDTLVGAEVDPAVAAVVELHETVEAMEGPTDDSMTTTTGMGGGMMSMQPVDEIPVPAGDEVALEPGGYHIMLLDLAEPLESGTTITVTLTFAESGTIEVAADVRDMAP